MVEADARRLSERQAEVPDDRPVRLSYDSRIVQGDRGVRLDGCRSSEGEPCCKCKNKQLKAHESHAGTLHVDDELTYNSLYLSPRILVAIGR